MRVTRHHLRYALVSAGWLYSARLAVRTDPAMLQLLLVLTCFFLIASNLGRRLPGESSAYSVYNGGRSLPGQLRAEQFDDEVRRGAGASDRPFRSPDRPGEPLLAGDRHARVLAELRREALAMRPRARRGR